MRPAAFVDAPEKHMVGAVFGLRAQDQGGVAVETDLSSRESGDVAM
ncbi:MAG: hypothetical protein JWN34_4284 [Bryobacterales bacterium]|nr:hypothetical protein [Bryobacterales bacterium]